MITPSSSNPPTLRFKDRNGRNYPDWQQYRIGELFDVSAGGDIDRSRVSKIKDDKHPYPVYANGDTNSGLYGYTDTFKQDGNCITVTGRGNLGTATARHEPFYPIVRLLTLRPKNRINIVFGEYLINNVNFFVESTGVPQLTGPQISTYRIMIPELSEQESIADFLSAVDKKIDLLEKKKELLEQYKKGVMQQIFSQKIRFKDEAGNDYPNWVADNFKNILASIPSRKFQIKSSEIRATGATPVVDQGQQKIAGYTNSGNIEFQEAPVIVFGDHTTAIKYIDFPFVVGADGTKILKAKQGSLKYLYYYLQYIDLASEGYKRHFSILKEKTLALPSLEEQRKIAALLSALEKKIDMLDNQFKLYRKWKKGLLQRMFV